MTLYRQYADEIAAMIADGQLKPGERLPSVRQARERRGISASTVFQAYQILERDGLIVARPQSGFYVNLPVAQRVAAAVEPSQVGATHVEVSDLVFQVLGQVRNRGTAPLGSAFPGPDLFPLNKLARAAAAGLGAMDPGAIVEHLSPGSAGLIEQIAARYRIDGIALADDEIVVTNGALEALNAALQLTTKSGDTVVIESPAFYAALQAIERLGLKALPVETSPITGLNLDALERVLARERVGACWLMPSFQNPTGALMPDATRRDLVTLLAKHGVPLIEDDVYGELYFGSQRPKPAKTFDGQGLVLHCSSFSKTLAPGYRVGWVAAGRYAQQLQRHTLMTTMSASLPAQSALTRFLQAGGYERHLRRLRGALHARVAAASSLAESIFPAGTRVSRPRGGYFLWLELPDSCDAMLLHDRALMSKIGVAPGHLFSPDQRYSNCLRINVGHEAAIVLPALRQLAKLAHEIFQGVP